MNQPFYRIIAFDCIFSCGVERLIASIASLQTVHGRTLWRRPLNVICSALQSKGWTHKSVFSIYSYIYFLWTRVMHNKRKQFESTHLWNSYLISNRRNVESVNKWFLRCNELVVARRMVVDDRTQRCRGRCHGPSGHDPARLHACHPLIAVCRAELRCFCFW